MQLSTNLEKIFYNYVRVNPELLSIVTPDFFQTKEIKECYAFDEKFYKKYTQIPTYTQMVNMILTKSEQDNLEEDEIKSKVRKVKAIYKVALGEYDEHWLKDNTEAWVEWKNLDSSFYDAISYMKSAKVDVNNIKEVIAKTKSIILERANIDLTFDIGLDFWNPEHHFQNKANTFDTGFEWFNHCFGGGYRMKSLYCVVGPAKKGKSLLLSNLATMSVKNGYDTAFISFEMIDSDVIARMGADMLDIDISEYADFSQNPKKVQARLKKLKKVDGISRPFPGNLIIKEFPTGAATVIDLENYLRKLEEVKGIKLKTVFVDYINIISNWRNPNSEATYMKIKQIAEDLRGMAMRNDWTVVTATQTNKSGMESSNLNMTDVAESSGLVHTVDGLIGLMQDEEQRAEGIFIFKALALRHSGHQHSRRRFFVDYSHMRITEDTSQSLTNEN